MICLRVHSQLPIRIEKWITGTTYNIFLVDISWLQCTNHSIFSYGGIQMDEIVDISQPTFFGFFQNHFFTSGNPFFGWCSRPAADSISRLTARLWFGECPAFSIQIQRAAGQHRTGIWALGSTWGQRGWSSGYGLMNIGIIVLYKRADRLGRWRQLTNVFVITTAVIKLTACIRDIHARMTAWITNIRRHGGRIWIVGRIMSAKSSKSSSSGWISIRIIEGWWLWCVWKVEEQYWNCLSSIRFSLRSSRRNDENERRAFKVRVPRMQTIKKFLLTHLKIHMTWKKEIYMYRERWRWWNPFFRLLLCKKTTISS